MSTMYFRISDPSDVRDLSEQMPAWVAAGNPKANEWAVQPASPSQDAVWKGGQWVVPPAPTFTAEEWVAQHLSPLQVAALSEFRLALVQAGKPLGPKMSALKTWLEQMMAASVTNEPRNDWTPPPATYAEASAEAVAALGQV